MRKILSGFLATAMVASVCATATFAANSAATLEIDVNAGGLSAGTTGTLDKAILTFTLTDGTIVTRSVKMDKTYTGAAGSTDFTAQVSKDVVAAFNDGDALKNIEFDKAYYDLKLTYVGGDSSAADPDIKGVFSPAAAIALRSVTMTFADSGWTTAPATDTITFTTGAGGSTADIETEGTTLSVRDTIICDGEGNPIPLTEDPRGVDKDLNTDDGVQSGKTVYFMIKDGQYKFNDDSYWKLKISKGDNGKYVKAVSDVTKNFGSDLYNAVNGAVVSNTGDARHRYIKVELNEIFTDDEYKITLDMRLSAKSPAARVYNVDEDTEFKVSDFSFYMKNMTKDADNDWKVGIGGLMLNPLENDWNEVTYHDEDGDLAFMKFFADSDVSKFYAKLSTKWEHADYASYFNDQDAFVFDFTGSPKISATSRCDLQIYNPFINEDGNETIDPATATIYQVIDGDLFDVTDSFTYEEGNNGDMAFVTRTRFLGTYIICEKPVEEAVDDSADVPTDLVPEDTTPSEVTPDNNNGGKAPANTGKYL